MSIYTLLKSRGCTLDHAGPDLLILSNSKSDSVLSGRHLVRFRSPRDNQLWYELPWCNDLYWAEESLSGRMPSQSEQDAMVARIKARRISTTGTAISKIHRVDGGPKKSNVVNDIAGSKAKKKGKS